jgi:hypothetical protein
VNVNAGVGAPDAETHLITTLMNAVWVLGAEGSSGENAIPAGDDVNVQVCA